MTWIRPFVPAKDFDRSISFYKAIGFDLQYQDDTIAIFEHDRAGFLLQNFYVREFAENCMQQYFVNDLDGWWKKHTPGLVDRFGVQEPKAPQMQPWGMRVGYLWDPSGVLWQVSEP